MNAKKPQIERFKAAAREAEVQDEDDALDRVFGKLDLKKKPEASDEKEND